MKKLIPFLLFLLVGTACGSDSKSGATQPITEPNSRIAMGTWAGTGTIVVSGNQNGNGSCRRIQMTIRRFDNILHLESLFFECNFYYSNFGPFDAEIRGNELWNTGERIGTFTDDAISVRISRLPGSLQTFDFRLNPANGKLGLTHHSVETVGGGTRTIDHAAELDYFPNP